MMELVILVSFIILIYLVVITKWQCERIILKCCSQKAPRSFQGVGHMLLRGCHCVRLALAGFIFKYLFAPTHVWWLQEEIRGRQKPPCPLSENEVTTLRMKCELLGDALTPCGVGGGGSSQGAPSGKSALLCWNNGVPQDGKITPSPNSKLLQLSKNSKLLTRRKGCLLRKSFPTEKPDESISAEAESPPLTTAAVF